MDSLERITQHPGTMGGRACIRGMRVTVGMIVGQIELEQGALLTIDSSRTRLRLLPLRPRA